MLSVPGLENAAEDECSRLTSRQFMATRTRPFMVPLVQNWVLPKGEPVDEFLRVLQDAFSDDEVWPQPYYHLYVLLRSGGSVGKDPYANTDACPEPQFDAEQVVQPGELETLPVEELATEDLHESATRPDNASNEIPDQSVNPGDPPEADIDRCLRVAFGKELR